MSLFHSESMQHVSLFMRFDDAPLVSVILAKTGVFDPSMATQKDEKFPDIQGAAYRRIFNHAVSDWQKISEFLDITSPSQLKQIKAISKTQLLEVENRLSEIWQVCLKQKENQRRLDKQFNSLQHLFKLLDHFSNLDIDLSCLKKNFEFLDVRLGIVPISHLNRLKDALGIEDYLLSSYLKETENAHVIVAGVRESTDVIQSLLESASFQLLQIPEEFQEHPQLVRAKLNEKLKGLKRQYLVMEQANFKLREEYKHELIDFAKLLTLAKPYAVLSREMLRKGQLTKIEGWVPTKQIDHIKQSLNLWVKNPVVIKTRAPICDEYSTTPSYLLRPKWIAPFLTLVRNYGTPGYREFEPSWFFTLSYILMFGIMFGDVGHGASIIAIAWLVKAKWPEFFSFFVSIGFSSVLFGFLYGSVFAYEQVLPALWMAPMHDPMLMLSLALAWGISFIIFLNLVSIYNRIRGFKLYDALFQSNGLAGLFLYIGILKLILDLSNQQLDGFNWVLIIVPGIIIFIYQWKNSSIQYSERLLVVLIETYESIINYLSNTISFLRVAAFTLNHSALAVALYTLAAMTDGLGHGLAIIFGNLFILVLEGAIVGIQVLRLEYYEGFSRFFSGNGSLFKPLQLSPQYLSKS